METKPKAQAKVAVQVTFTETEYDGLTRLAGRSGRSKPAAIRSAVAAEVSRSDKRHAPKSMTETIR